MVRQADVLVGGGFVSQVVCDAEQGEDEFCTAADLEFAADIVNVSSCGVG